MNFCVLQKPKTPWKAILSSVPVWALIGAHIGNGWSLAIVLTELPSYINSVLGFEISAVSILFISVTVCDKNLGLNDKIMLE